MSLRISAFFPAHNEEGNIAETVTNAIQVLSELSEAFEVIVVDDGSTDRTTEIVRKIMEADPRVRLVQHDRNLGYGAALRSGFAAARYEWVFFSDSDLQFDLRDLARLLPYTHQADLIVGYRIRRQDPLYRRLLSWAWNRLVRWGFDVGVQDVDCAFKLLRREVVQRLPLCSEGAFISTELLCRARVCGARIVEVGVPHYPRRWGKQSGASVRVVLRAFRELWQLRRELRSWAARSFPGLPERPPRTDEDQDSKDLRERRTEERPYRAPHQGPVGGERTHVREPVEEVPEER